MPSTHTVESTAQTVRSGYLDPAAESAALDEAATVAMESSHD